MPRIKKSTPIPFTEEELKMIAFLSYQIGGSAEGPRGITDGIAEKMETYFERKIDSTSWYDDFSSKVEPQHSSIYFRRY